MPLKTTVGNPGAPHVYIVERSRAELCSPEQVEIEEDHTQQQDIETDLLKWLSYERILKSWNRFMEGIG